MLLLLPCYIYILDLFFKTTQVAAGSFQMKSKASLYGSWVAEAALC